MILNNFILTKLKNKAAKSSCRYNISAIGLNAKGEILYTAFNVPRFKREGGSLHAEMNLMRNCSKALKTIIICRVNKHGKIMPIHPCKTCKNKADELNVNILTVSEMI